MLNILITFLTFILILVGVFMVLVILMQRANPNAGMGSAFGGGVAESAFGADTTNILTKATKWSAVAFFLLSFVLYLLWINEAKVAEGDDGPELPLIAEEATEAQPAIEAETSLLTESAEAVESAIDSGMESAGEAFNSAEESAESANDAINAEAEEATNP